MKLIVVVSIIILVLGCATNSRIEDMSSEQRSRINKIVILKGDADNPYQVLETISGLSCNRNKFQQLDVSEVEALQGVRIQAAKLNADAVINTFCQKNSDTDWKNNCWASVKCIGDAVVYR